MKIIIVGGGIGGLTSAIALRAAGFEAPVFERAPALKEVGAAIGLMPNATRVLAGFGMLEKLQAHGDTIAAGIIQPNQGRPLKAPMAIETGVPALLLHRADLQQILVDAVPAAALVLGRELIAVSQTAESVTATFANGETVEGDLLIGADGLNSAVRRILWNDGPPVYRGYQCWRGVNPAGKVPVVAEVLGRGVRVGLVPMGRRGAAWWLCANEAENASDEPEGRRTKLLRLLTGWHESVRELIGGTPEEALFKNAIYDRPVTPGWSRGRVLLLGDAAHPTTPNMAQGGGMAIEDAALLTRCLTHFPSFSLAFGRFEALRYERVKTVVDTSRLWGRMGQWKNPLACWFRNRLLAATPDKRLIEQLTDLWNYDVGQVQLEAPA